MCASVFGLATILFVARYFETAAPSNGAARSSPAAALEATLRTDEPYVIELTGSQYRWQIRYPGTNQSTAARIDVPNARELHIPRDTAVVINLKSADYVYLFSLPEFGLKQIAVPSLEFRLEFRSSEAGRFSLFGDELCGDPHPELQGNLVVEPREEFLSWLAARRHLAADVPPVPSTTSR